MKNAIYTLAVSMMATAALAAGPGGSTGGPGGGGNQPGSGGSGASFTFDTFLTDPATSGNAVSYAGVWSGYSSGATSITLASSVSDAVEGVMSGCTTLKTADLSAATGLTKLPARAFAGCTALTTVTLPSTITEIGDGAFEGCTSLKTLTASGVETIGVDAFRGCTALTTQPSGTVIGDGAFAQSGLTSVALASATLGDGVCAGCASLTSATAPAALPDGTFSGCTSLEFDPSGCTSIGAAALAGLPITTFTLSSTVTLSGFSLSADSATVATILTFDGASVPSYDDTAFLGRSLTASYSPVEGTSTRIEAEALVTWLMAQAEANNADVAQPTDDDGATSYATASLETWLSTASNASAVKSFCYATALAADSSFAPLTVSGTSFLLAAPDSGTTSSVTVSVVGATALTSEFTSTALTLSATAEDGTQTYVSSDETSACFARLKYAKSW